MSTPPLLPKLHWIAAPLPYDTLTARRNAMNGRTLLRTSVESVNCCQAAAAAAAAGDAKTSQIS